MIAQLNDITISGAALECAIWAFIGFTYGVALMSLIDSFNERKKLRKV